MGTKLDEQKAHVDALKSQTASSSSVIAGKVANVGAAVRESRPIITTNVKVNVTAGGITRTVQVTGRYGQPVGSRNQNNIGVSGAR